MKTNDFAWYLSLFLAKHLPGERNLSVNTISVYRDSFKLFLMFCDSVKGIKPEK